MAAALHQSARTARIVGIVVVAALVVALAIALNAMTREPALSRPGSAVPAPSLRSLPSPDRAGGQPLNAALAIRRSVRDFAATPLSLAEVGQLLWAAQGVTSDDGRRTAPSAGALYPLEVYVVAADGLARYVPLTHGLEQLAQDDRRAALAGAALGQEAVEEAPVVIVIVGVPNRTEARYAGRATRYVWLEAGHAAQNVLLEAVSLGLGAVPMGAFDDSRVAEVLALPADQLPLYLIPVGRPR